MTLNVAHARAEGRNQMFQSEDQARHNLSAIADVVKRENPHVVAFQEIDRNSFWNGRFDHTAFVAENTSFPHHFSGAHIDGENLEYGTALLSRLDLKDQKSVSFKRPFARMRKGFVVSTIDWPGEEDLQVDLVSVHFDFLTPKQRHREATELIKILKMRDNPRIIMGDLNTDYNESQLIPRLEEALGLYTWAPNEEAITFPRFDKRLDWVLVSDMFHILSHEVLPDPLSDHRAIIAEVMIDQSLAIFNARANQSAADD